MLKINGTQVAEPAFRGVEITEEPVWASNTGRSQTGKMTGDIVAWKKTVAVTFPPLSPSETSLLISTIKNAGAFFPIQFTNDLTASSDPTDEDDLAEEIHVYASNIPRTVYSLAHGLRKHEGVTVTFIEQ